MNKLETELKKIIWRKSPRGPDSHLCILYVFTVWKVLSGRWFSVYCADIMANVCVFWELIFQSSLANLINSEVQSAWHQK